MGQPPFDKAAAGRIARELVHTSREAALGTLDVTGHPSVSHVACATEVDGAPLILLSDLAVHTRNVRHDPRVSLMFLASAHGNRDTNARARVSLTGEVGPVSDKALARDRFLRRHPDAELYIDFGDMHLMRVEPRRAHLVAGFGKISNVAPAEIVAVPEAAAAMAQVDAGACAHMNEDHLDALSVMAANLAGAAEGAWRAVAVDPRGIDLWNGGGTVRVEYDALVAGAGELRRALKELADKARAQRGQK